MRALRFLSVVAGFVVAIIGGAQTAGPDIGELRRLAEALVAQLDLAHREAVFGTLAPDLEVTKRHAQRVINVLEGKNGPHYRADAGDVGDGVGVLGYLQQLRERVKSTPLAPVLMLGIETVLFDAGAALEQSKQALQSSALSRARFALRSGRALIYSARGSVTDPVGEGGARAILARLNALR